MIFAVLPASAQTFAPSSGQTAPDQSRPEPKPDNPGLLNELGKLFVKPADLFPSLKSTPDVPSPAPPPGQSADAPTTTPPPAVATPTPPAAPARPMPPTTATAPAAKSPTVALVPQVITGRATCPLSSNGGPDCKAGADKLCQDRGFAGGRNLDMDSAQTCSSKALLAGARTIKDICKTETFVTRAMCQ